MHKNRVKIVLALTLTVAILICNTVSVFAYEPIITINSNDWGVVSDSLFLYTYPDFYVSGVDDTEFKSFKDLYGESCYWPINWYDAPNLIDTVDIVYPLDLLKYDGIYLFKCYSTYYLLNYEKDYTKIGLDADGRIYVECSGSSSVPTYGEVQVYTLSYPYSTWHDPSTVRFGVYGDTGYNRFDSALLLFNTLNLNAFYCNSDVYLVGRSSDYVLSDSVIRSADNYNLSNKVYTYEFDYPLKCLVGSIDFELTYSDLERFSLGRYAFRFDNSGVINVATCSLAALTFRLCVFDPDYQLLEEYVLLNEGYYGIGANSDSLIAPSCFVNDYIVYWDNHILEASPESEYRCTLYFSVVSDAALAFFPGTVDIIEYESYREDEQHQNILDSIGDASSSINDAISESAKDIVDGFENSLQVIVSGDTGVDRVVIDTSDLDNITVEEESILDKVYGDIDSEINKYLPEGYKDPYEYLNDSISDFSSLNSTFAFIKEFYDRTVEATGMGAVILFVLSFGFATYAIGRRLS